MNLLRRPARQCDHEWNMRVFIQEAAVLGYTRTIGFGIYNPEFWLDDEIRRTGIFSSIRKPQLQLPAKDDLSDASFLLAHFQGSHHIGCFSGVLKPYEDYV